MLPPTPLKRVEIKPRIMCFETMEHSRPVAC
jgi:hypothetical protein